MGVGGAGGADNGGYPFLHREKLFDSRNHQNVFRKNLQILPSLINCRAGQRKVNCRSLIIRSVLSSKVKDKLVPQEILWAAFKPRPRFFFNVYF